MAMHKGHVDRRKLVGLTAAGAATLALGPASSGNVSGAPAVLKQEQQVLNVAFSGTQVEDFDETIAAGFTELYPEATINFIPVQSEDWPDYFSKVLTLIAAGTVPDVMDVATEGTQLFAAEGLTVPIDEYVTRDREEMQDFFSDVHPSLIEAMLYQGHMYQLPFMWNSRNMYLNTSSLQEAGFDFPSTDWTKDDFYEMVRGMTPDPGNPPFGYGWSNRVMGGWLHWIYVNGGNLLEEAHWDGGDWLWDTFYQDDPSAQDRGGGWNWGAPQANIEANLEALEFMVQLAEEGLTPSVDVGAAAFSKGSSRAGISA